MLPEVKMIGQNIASFMTKNKITVRYASQRSGLALGTISEITNGRDKRISYYFILAKSIGMPTSSIFETKHSPEDIMLLHHFTGLPSAQKKAIKQLIESLIQ